MKFVFVTATKGGVGKTLISLAIAKTLAEQGEFVNFLDCDISSSSFYQFIGEQENIEINLDEYDNFIPKIWRNEGNSIKAFAMSMISGKDKSVKVSGEAYKEIITSALKHTNWYFDAGLPKEPIMILDLPQGSSKDILNTIQIVINEDKNLRLLGSFVISQNSQQDAFRKALELVFLDENGNRVLGVIENMSSFKCENPECNKVYEIFGKSQTAEIMQEMATKFQIEEPEFLGKIPMSLEIAKRNSKNGILPEKLPEEFNGTITKAVKIIQDSKPLKKSTKQKIKEKKEEIKLSVAKTLAKMIKFANAEIRLDEIYSEFGYENVVKLSVTRDKAHTELLIPSVCMQLSTTKITVFEDDEIIPDFEVRTDYQTLARIIFGYMIHSPTRKRYDYYVGDAYRLGEMKVMQHQELEIGTVNNLKKFIDLFFSNEKLLGQVRTQMKQLESFV